MKLNILTLFTALMIVMGTLSSFAQNQLPHKNLKDLSGKDINTSSLDNGESPIIISFWATWCKPCVKELTAISEVYEDWVDETGVKVIAISIDDARMSHLVPSYVRGRGWEYDVYVDANGDFKRAMNVVNIPHTFLLDKDGKVVYQHTSYAPGDEEELYEEVLKLVEGK
ncbi:MAG: TlpA disulfide reductase family protein [Bacteroidota bacterium]